MAREAAMKSPERELRTACVRAPCCWPALPQTKPTLSKCRAARSRTPATRAQPLQLRHERAATSQQPRAHA
eukprot:5769143-Prymnesium_polylepis.2